MFRSARHPTFLRVQNILGFLIVLTFAGVAIAAPLLAPQSDPAQPEMYHRANRSTRHIPQPPSPGLPLGTTPDQMDVYYSLIWGTRSAFAFGTLVTLATATIGIIIGAGSAAAGGRINRLVMRITDGFLTFPAIAGVWLFTELMIPPETGAAATPMQSWMADLGITPLAVALVVFSWMSYARLVNSGVTALKEMDFVQASYALGGSRLRTIFRHLIPNTISPAVVLAAKDVGGMVIWQATFTFIGISSESVWGNLLAQGRNWIIGPGGNLSTYWWLFVPPTLALILFGIGWNLLGDGLVDWLNPRSSETLQC
jgi:peptide/nickel transport system permease protein